MELAGYSCPHAFSVDAHFRSEGVHRAFPVTALECALCHKPEVDKRLAKLNVHTVEGVPEKSRPTSPDMLHDRLNEEFEQIYNLALTLTVENDHATVVRVGPPEN